MCEKAVVVKEAEVLGDSCVRVRESEIGEAAAQGVGSSSSSPRYG